MTPKDRQIIDRMFHPRGLAVFGSVATPGTFAQSVVLSLVKYGYPGRLCPISRRGGEVAGIRVYPSLDEVESPVDLAAIAVPANAVPEVLRDCLKHRVAGAQIHSSGFAETGEPEGLALQEEIRRIAREGIRVMGPNCFGIYCPRGGVTIIPGFDFAKESGAVAMMCQSGGVAGDFGHEARGAGLGLSKLISFGNGADLDAVELLDYLAGDSETRYIAAYLEGVRDGRSFFEVLRRTAREKPVVVWKGGLTPLGGRATLSHTASMGGETQVWAGALTQSGAVSVQGMEETLDTLVALRHLTSAGRQIALMGGGGAIGVYSSDLAHRWGLDVPTFSRETQARLRKWFPTPGNSVANPLDTGTPALPSDVVKGLAEEVLTREPIDALVLILLLHPLEVTSRTLGEMVGREPAPRGSYLESLREPLARLRDETGKDVVLVLGNQATGLENLEVEEVSRRARLAYHAEGIPVYPSTERALRAIRNATRARRP